MAAIVFRTLRPNLNLGMSPGGAKKWTKIVTGVSAVVIGISIITFGIFTAVSNNEDFQKSHGVTTANLLEQQSAGVEKSDAATPEKKRLLERVARLERTHPK